MTTTRAVFTVSLAVLLFRVSAGAVDDAKPWGKCGTQDREALLVGALLREAEETLYTTRDSSPVTCVVVGVGDDTHAADPPNIVMHRLRRIAPFSILLARDRAKCKAPVTTWVAEPRCSGSNASVRTRSNDHCPIPYRKVGNRWEQQATAACQ